MMKCAVVILLSFVLLLTACGQGENGKNEDIVSSEKPSSAASDETASMAASSIHEAPATAAERDVLPAMTNADGVRLQVGMSRAEYIGFFGQAFEAELFYGDILANGWMTNYPGENIGALSVDDRIVLLSLGDGWTLENGIAKGMPIERIREILGTEDSVGLADPENRDSENYFLYHYADGGTLELSYGQEGDMDVESDVLSSIRVYSAGFDEASDALLGVVYFDQSGEGSAAVEQVFLSPYIGQTLYYEGATELVFVEEVTGDEYVLFRTEQGSRGMCRPQSPEVLRQKNAKGSFRIETGGAWRLRVSQSGYPPRGKISFDDFDSPASVQDRTTPATYPEAPENTAGRDRLPTLSNADGVRLQVGMSRGEFEIFYGRTIENGWMMRSPRGNVAVLSIDETIVLLSPGRDWTLSNGIALGMPIERVREILGKENRMIPEDPEDPESRYWVHSLYYYYADGGIMVIQYYKNGDTFSEADTVSDIYISSVALDRTISSFRGTIYFDENGKGNGVLEKVSLDPFRDISLDFEGAVKLYFVEEATGVEYALFVADGGAGTCRVKPPEELREAFFKENHSGGDVISISGSFRIETDGPWQLRLVQLANPPPA